jgi:hypothetical protein
MGVFCFFIYYGEGSRTGRSKTRVKTSDRASMNATRYGAFSAALDYKTSADVEDGTPLRATKRQKIPISWESFVFLYITEKGVGRAEARYE